MVAGTAKKATTQQRKNVLAAYGDPLVVSPSRGWR
jgi:hypothetical protein